MKRKPHFRTLKLKLRFLVCTVFQGRLHYSSTSNGWWILLNWQNSIRFFTGSSRDLWLLSLSSWFHFFGGGVGRCRGGVEVGRWWDHFFQVAETCTISGQCMFYDHVKQESDTLEHDLRNRVFSLTWLAAILVYSNKRQFLHRVQFLEDWLGTPTWSLFLCLGKPIWRPWRHLKTLYRPVPIPLGISLSRFRFFSTVLHFQHS